MMKLFKKKRKLETYRSMWNSAFTVINSIQSFSISNPSDLVEKKEDSRIEKKPIEVWEKLKSQPVEMDFTNLDDKIKVIKQRIRVLEDNMRDFPGDEYEVLGYLEARKKYSKHKELFKWPITTEKLIEKLCSEYKVEIARFEEFYTIVPYEGIEELKKYKEACKKIRKDNPIIRLIVPKIEDKNKEIGKRHRDPILLASSPFGRWDYVLGAWDKEVAIVDSLIYDGE